MGTGEEDNTGKYCDDPNASCSYECIVLGECTPPEEIGGVGGAVAEGEEDTEVDEGDE
jgi:hypothetical protein